MRVYETRGPVDEMAARVRALGARLDDAQLDRYARYAALLRERNQEVNLTAIVEPSEIATKHFLDSLTALGVRTWRRGERLIDVGSGAGFPGLALAIALPGLEVTLVESVGKKARFLEEAAREVGVRARVVQARAEELAHEAEYREAFDVATARALPGLATNLELLLPFVRVGGHAVAYKGHLQDELGAAAKAARALGGDLLEPVGTASLGLGDVLPGRHLAVARKLRPTPARYPRRTVDMRRRPW